MPSAQAGILADVPALARYLTLQPRPGADPGAALQRLRALVDGEQTVIGIGPSVIAALGAVVPGLKVFPAYARAGVQVPATPGGLWCWLRGTDRGELVHRSRAVSQALAPDFEVSQCLDAFRYDTGRDLTG